MEETQLSTGNANTFNNPLRLSHSTLQSIDHQSRLSPHQVQLNAYLLREAQKRANGQ
jgi:hypothetical protein